jgi:hypothetical protein
LSDYKEITLKASLAREILPFLSKAEMDCITTLNGMVALAEHLMHYQEEGKSLFPEIYIIDDLELVGKILTNFEYYKIGESEKSIETMLKALKKCAPLTGEGWVIYILRKTHTYEYGVFRTASSILSISIEEALINQGSKELKCILIRQISDNITEIKNFISKSLIITFGSVLGDKKKTLNRCDDFVDSIVQNVDEKIKDQITNFYKKVFNNVMRKGHGTLACVIDHRKRKIPQTLSDGIFLTKRIEVAKQILQKDSGIDLISHVKLEGSLSIISGMMLSDGITVFSNDGSLISYNVFLKHSSKLNKTSTNGGARTRTYLGLCNLIGKDLEAAFIQSQDGKTEFKINGK